MAEHGTTSVVSLSVPAGFVYVIRDLDVFLTAGISDATGYLKGSSGQAIFYFTQTALNSGYHSWRGRQVFEAGESFSFDPGGDAMDFTLSGYKLTAP
jgi:hypothetical protein